MLADDRFDLVRFPTERELPTTENERSLQKVRILEDQLDGLLLRDLPFFQATLLEASTPAVEDAVEPCFIDQTRQDLAARWILREIVALEVDACFFEEGDRLPTTRSARFEPHFDRSRHSEPSKVEMSDYRSP